MKKNIYIILALSLAVLSNQDCRSFFRISSFDDFDLMDAFATIDEQMDEVRSQTRIAMEEAQRNFNTTRDSEYDEEENFVDAAASIKVDYDQEDNKITITINLPNIDVDAVNVIPEDKNLFGTIPTKDGVIIKIKIKGNQLELSAYREDEVEETSDESFSYCSNKNVTETFQTLPCSIEPSDTQIEYEDGKLTIEIPTKAKTKRIKIKRK